MKKRIVLITILFISVATLAPKMSSALGLEIGAGYWGQNPSGDIAYKPLSSSDSLDIERNLNYDQEYRPFARIKAEMPLLLPNVYFIATPMKFEERGSKANNFTFGDTTFDSTAELNTKLRMDLYDICIYYSLPLLETATLKTLNAEIGLNARIIGFEAEVSGINSVSGQAVTESESKTVPVPMVYVGAQLNPLDIFSLEAEGRGIAYGSNHYYDIIGRVKIKPMGPLFIAGGYRYNDIKIDYSDIDVSITFSGPFVEAGVFF